MKRMVIVAMFIFMMLPINLQAKEVKLACGGWNEMSTEARYYWGMGYLAGLGEGIGVSLRADWLLEINDMCSSGFGEPGAKLDSIIKKQKKADEKK